jgi:2-methylisocitrate lyase-like PEP mutase family enzyme
VLTQQDKSIAFAALHERPEAFIIPNPWDIGSARLLANLGFQALATTSAGFAFSIGRGDGAVGREQMLAHVSAIAGATDLPVSADLENGFGDDVETVAATIAHAAAAGAVGGSIEDVSSRPRAVVYELAHAVDRVRAAAAAARALPFHFMLTARAENFIAGRPDLADTIARLQAYQDAGADVLYAPGLTTLDQITTVVRSVDRPVNVLLGLPHVALDRAALSAAGVRRISIGSALARAAYGEFLRGAREMSERGTFAFAERAATSREITGMLE